MWAITRMISIFHSLSNYWNEIKGNKRRSCETWGFKQQSFWDSACWESQVYHSQRWRKKANVKGENRESTWKCHVCTSALFTAEDLFVLLWAPRWTWSDAEKVSEFTLCEFSLALKQQNHSLVYLLPHLVSSPGGRRWTHGHKSALGLGLTSGQGEKTERWLSPLIHKILCNLPVAAAASVILQTFLFSSSFFAF